MHESSGNAIYVMRLHCTTATALKIADAIFESFADSAAAAFEEAPDRPGSWIVEAHFGLAPDEARVRALVAAAASDEAARALRFGRLAARDWVAHALEGLAPVRVGQFVVHGAHDRGAARAHEIGIEIEAALAFGTGHHGSTHGCLAFLARIAKRRRPRAVLDIGTGTGILAIAAARLFRVPVKAADIDAIAVATARANAARNGVAAFVDTVQADGLKLGAFMARYDLVAANILAAPLRKLAPALAQMLAPGGEIILSGLLPDDVPGIISAYRARNIAFISRLDIDGWATLLMRRPFPARHAPRLQAHPSSALRVAQDASDEF